MKGKTKNRRGQAVVMVTLSLFVLFGILGLAVDLGWSFFIKKSAQAAADSAALAAAAYVYHTYGAGPYSSCPSGVVCGQTTPTPCPATDNLQNGCLYAQQNGFTASGNQNVTMAADITSPAPTVPNVQVNYWVTARVSQGIPQLFSSVLGNTLGVSAARATAALAQITYPGTVYALNRQNDTSSCGTGVGICGGGNARINSSGGIFISSNCPSASGCGGQAGDLPKEASKGSGATYVRSGGTTDWTYTNIPDGPMFNDPMSGKGQPPAPSALGASGLPAMPPSGIYDHPVAGGTGSSAGITSPSPCTASCPCLTPGYYYATQTVGCGKSCTQTVPSGAPISFGGCVTFLPNSPGGNSWAFGQYVFFGGASFGGTATFYPGEYIFAGVVGSSTTLLNLSGATLQQSGTGTAGGIFIFTDGVYTGLPVPSSLLNSSIYSQLTFGSPMVSMKNGSTVLQGLNASSGSLPSGLVPFAPVMWWTDQRSSPILYNSNGNVVTTGTCTTETGGAPSLDNPCLNPTGGAKPDPPGPWIYLDHGNASAILNGTIYQPRGSLLEVTDGTGSITGPVQIITGSIKIDSGNGSIGSLAVLGNPPKGTVVSLIE